jgi:hypothetical protein
MCRSRPFLLVRGEDARLASRGVIGNGDNMVGG